MSFPSLTLCYKGVAKYLGNPSLVSLDLPTPRTTTKVELHQTQASAFALLETAKPNRPNAAPSESDASTAVDTLATLPDFHIIHECDSDGENVSSQPSLTEGCCSPKNSAAPCVQEAVWRKAEEASKAQEWTAGAFEKVRTLQAAPRNQGSVELMRSLETGDFVAVKVMPNSWVTNGPGEFRRRYPKSAERPWIDIGVTRYLCDCGFPEVCTPRGVFRDRQNTYLVSSLATDGDLFAWLDQGPNPGRARERVLRPIVLQLLEAVRALHNLGVAHRDISLENVLLTKEDGRLAVKLIDFGMATFSRHCDGSAGKRSYVAPELSLPGEHDAFLCDGFALGVVAFTLAARSYPWDATRPGACKRFDFVAMHGFRAYLARRRVSRVNSERLSEVLSAPFTDVLEALLALQPESRATLGERCWSEDHAGRASVWEMPWVIAQD